MSDFNITNIIQRNYEYYSNDFDWSSTEDRNGVIVGGGILALAATVISIIWTRNCLKYLCSKKEAFSKTIRTLKNRVSPTESHLQSIPAQKAPLVKLKKKDERWNKLQQDIDHLRKGSLQTNHRAYPISIFPILFDRNPSPRFIEKSQVMTSVQPATGHEHFWRSLKYTKPLILDVSPPEDRIERGDYCPSSLNQPEAYGSMIVTLMKQGMNKANCLTQSYYVVDRMGGYYTAYRQCIEFNPDIETLDYFIELINESLAAGQQPFIQELCGHSRTALIFFSWLLQEGIKNHTINKTNFNQELHAIILDGLKQRGLELAPQRSQFDLLYQYGQSLLNDDSDSVSHENEPEIPYMDERPTEWLKSDLVHSRSNSVLSPRETNVQYLDMAKGKYLHANWIGDPDEPLAIATQLPTESTFPLFWELAWDHGSRIIDLSTADETTREVPYYPTQLKQKIKYGSYRVKLIKESVLPNLKNCTEHKYEMKNLETGKRRTISRIHYKSWEKADEIPLSELEKLAELTAVNVKEKYPIIHCVDGVRKTGILAAAYCMRAKGKNTLTDLIQIITMIIKSRGDSCLWRNEQQLLGRYCVYLTDEKKK